MCPSQSGMLLIDMHTHSWASRVGDAYHRLGTRPTVEAYSSYVGCVASLAATSGVQPKLYVSGGLLLSMPIM